ncbi:recombinase family protein [Cryobacterium levicorallinum]|uniref:recombinase family protein n=1 Tax=Cryobacterium levicorallinum TaxID=995038 RepID=UPI003D07D4E9
MGAFAEFERALIRERQREGMTLAKKRAAVPRHWTRPVRQSCARRLPPAYRNLFLLESLGSAGKGTVS